MAPTGRPLRSLVLAHRPGPWLSASLLDRCRLLWLDPAMEDDGEWAAIPGEVDRCHVAPGTPGEAGLVAAGARPLAELIGAGSWDGPAGDGGARGGASREGGASFEGGTSFEGGSSFEGGASRADGPSPGDAGAGEGVLFCPSNDTHAKLFAPVAPFLPAARFATVPFVAERGVQALASLGIAAGPLVPSDLTTARLLVLGNDWGPVERHLVGRARERGIVTACLQEGCLDFGNHHGRAYDRMRHADVALLQGVYALGLLDVDHAMLTGNPRLEALRDEPRPDPPRVMVNVNFTYGVLEDWRERWVDAVCRACRAAGVEHFLSQHPRDRGCFPDEPVRPSSALVVHRHLAEASVLVTRFSTLVYEALRMGRRVIYYDPMGEGMRGFREDRTGGIHMARGEAELVEALRRCLGDEDDAARRAAFLARHCTARPGQASRRVARALLRLLAHPRLPRRPAGPMGRLSSWLRTRIFYWGYRLHRAAKGGAGR